MKFVLFFSALPLLVTVVSCFWDDATTTVYTVRTDTIPRQSFFRWQETQQTWKGYFFYGMDWVWLQYNRRLCVVAGISHEFTCIGTGTIMNRRVILTSCNLIDEFSNVQRELRIWALGSRGLYNTPYRYRVWRFTRLFPKSLNPEHYHGPRGEFQPRHDVCIIHTLDQMMIMSYMSYRGHYPYRSFVTPRHMILSKDVWFTGSGYEYPLHIKENYKIFITKVDRNNVIDCSKYLPKWWGKFICLKNVWNFPGVQNGGGFHTLAEPPWAEVSTDYILALGCFEIRYNEDRVLVFTDLRPYVNQIYFIAHLWRGQYYEYAYPQWGMSFGILFNSVWANSPNIPVFQIQDDFYELGKK